MSSEREKIISFSPPDISEMEIEEVCAALRSGWITTGPRTKKLEKELAEWIGTEKCVCLNSQTACAELVLRVLGVGEGDEVVVPAYTYTASASVIDHVGAKIVLIDSQKDNVEMDYDALEAAINERTKAILICTPNNLTGYLYTQKEMRCIASSSILDRLTFRQCNWRVSSSMWC